MEAYNGMQSNGNGRPHGCEMTCDNNVLWGLKNIEKFKICRENTKYRKKLKVS